MKRGLQHLLVVAGLCVASLALAVAFLFFWPLSVLLVGMSLMGWTIWEIWKGRASRHWPHTEGVILSSAFERRYTHMTTADKIGVRIGYEIPKVSYSFTVNGIKYVGHRPYYGTDYTRPRFDTVKFAQDKYVPVYYNPANPLESVLATGCPFFPIVIALFFGLLVVMGALVNYDFNQWKNDAFFQAKDAILILGIVAFIGWRRWIKRS